MKLKQIFILLFCLILLCALYVFLGWKEQRKIEQALEAGKVFSFEGAAIKELAFLYGDGTATVRGERIGEDRWKINTPNETIAPFHLMWNRVCEHFAGLMNERSLPSDISDFAQYGLETPVLSLEAVLETGETFSLQLGAIDILELHHYARLNKGNIFLITTDAFFELNRSLLDLRHRYLVSSREESLLDIEFARLWTGAASKSAEEDETADDSTLTDDEDSFTPELGEESVQIRVHREDGEAPWQLTSPVEALANYEKVEQMSHTLQYAVCTDFIDAPETLSDYGLDPPRARISMKDRNDTEWRTIWLGNVDTTPDKEGLFVKVEGQDAILVTSLQLLDVIPRSPLEWRDLRLVTQRITELKKLEYAAPDAAFTLGKDEEGRWDLLSPEMDDVNGLAVNAYLQFIKVVAGESAVDSAQAEKLLAAADRTITLEMEDGSRSTIALTPHPEKESAWLAKQDTGGMVLLDGVAVKMLLSDEEIFRSKEIVRLQKDQIQGLSFTLDENKYRFTQDEGTWTSGDDSGDSSFNQSDLDMLLDALNPLKIKSIVTKELPETLEDYGLDNPVFTAQITTGDQEITLSVGAVNPDAMGERFLQCSNRDGLFLISQDIMDQLREAVRGLPTVP